VPLALAPEALARLGALRVFFGRRSVGRDILDGVIDLMTEEPRLRLLLIETPEPRSVNVPGLVHTAIGRNGDADSKIEHFARVVESELADGTVALFELCYVDMTPRTDPDALFDRYRTRLDALPRVRPGVRVIHTTMALHGDPSRRRRVLDAVRGRTSERELNARRTRFNELLRTTYGFSAPLYDLAAIESTRDDGTRLRTWMDGCAVESLDWASSWDGGHLNVAGRRRAAAELLRLLSTL
jgi:lysophospholipase L1-like esterase